MGSQGRRGLGSASRERRLRPFAIAMGVVLALFGGRIENPVVRGVIVVGLGLAGLVVFFIALEMDRQSERDPDLDGGPLLRRAVPSALRNVFIVIGVGSLLVALIVGGSAAARALFE
jgi:hypothetical protein